jgi:hypothetical protein
VIEIINSLVIITLPKVVMMMTTQQFIEPLRRQIAEAVHE